MFDIQLPLSIFSPGSLGAASLTALDMEVVAAAGFTDLTDLAQQQKMLAQLQTGWLRQAPQKQFLVLPVFAKKRRVLFAGNAAGANQMRTTGACGDGGVTNRQDPPYKMSAALSALRCVIDEVHPKIKEQPNLQFLWETLETVRARIVRGDRLEARFLIEMAMVMYGDARQLAPLTEALTIEWQIANPLHILAKLGKLLEILHTKNRQWVTWVEIIKGANARVSSFIQLGSWDVAQRELQKLLEQVSPALREMPLEYAGIPYFLEGGLIAIAITGSSPNGLAALIHLCIDTARRDLPPGKAETDIRVLRGLLSQLANGRKDTAVSSVRTLIQHSRDELAGTLQEHLERLLGRLGESS